jgi:hypothetical protein
MKTSLELANELNDLLKRSKPFRNFHTVFPLVEQLISSLTVNEIVENPIEFTNPTKDEIEFFDAALADFLEIEEEALTNLTEEETAQLIPETKPPVKKTPAKPKAKK